MLKGQSILLVQDEETDALLIQRAFRNLQWTNPCKHLADGEQAIAYLSKDISQDDPPPALVLLDLRMPGISGLEVLTWIREQSQFKQLPVVIFTGSSKDEHRAEAMKRGATGYMVMPVKFDEMILLLGGLSKYLEPIPGQ